MQSLLAWNRAKCQINEPQLEKGGKWVFGWVIIRAERRMLIPLEAHCEYGFRAGDEIAFTKGSL